MIGELSNEEKEKMKIHEDNSVEQKWVNLSEKKWKYYCITETFKMNRFFVNDIFQNLFQDFFN